MLPGRSAGRGRPVASGSLSAPAPHLDPTSGLVSTSAGEVIPRWRGRLHGAAFLASLPAGALLAWRGDGALGRLALGIYAATLTAMFGVSAAFHLGSWSTRTRKVLGRLDHSTIFLAIAGTYTPFSLLAMSQPLGAMVLALVWLGAVTGICLRLAWAGGARHPRRLVLAGSYVALGWVGVVAFPQLFASLGMSGFALVLLGGCFYTAGAVVYSRRRPDPSPAVFGYHEVFHALVIAGAVAHFSAAALHLAHGR